MSADNDGPRETDRLEEGPRDFGSQSPQNEGPAATRRQFLTAFIAHFGALLMAEVWCYSATALPSMRVGEHALNISSHGEAWMGSITFLGGAIGSFIGGYITQKFGVKSSLQIITVPILIGWLMVTFFSNFIVILIGRGITGAFVAAVGISTTLIAEISNPKLRGRLNFLFDMTFCVGVLLIYIFGSFLNWRWQAGICAAQCVIYLLLLTQIYESPRFLEEHGKTEEAVKALKYYKNKDDVSYELGEIRGQLKSDVATEVQSGCGEWANFFVDKTVMKPVFISLALQFFLQVCGVVPIVCYAVDVFREAGSTHENLSTCIFGLVNLLATIAGYFCIDKWGRRLLFMFSEFILTTTLFGLGLFLYFTMREVGDSDSFEHDYYSWVPLMILVIYIIGYSFGVGPIPWVIMGEVINPKAKGFSSGLIVFGSRIFGFLVMFFFNDVMESLGQHGIYWLFAGVCFAGFFFALFLLPETKGKDMNAIQEEIRDNWVYSPCSSRTFK